MKRLLVFLGGLIIYAILTPGLTLAQKVVWSRTFECKLHSWDIVYSVQQTSNGGYILAGDTTSSDEKAARLIKTDSGGQKEWERTFKDSDDNISMRAYSVQQTTDEGYILGGSTSPLNGGLVGKAWIIKTDSEGQKEWERTFDRSQLLDIINCIQQTTDGGYILAGVRDYSAWLIKTDSEGQEKWERILGGGDYFTNTTSAESVQQTTDGGYILAGCAKKYGKYSFWFLKTDSEGQEEWERTFGGGDFTNASCIQQTTDGGYILAGRKDRGITTWDAWLIKTDSEGQKEWERTFGDKEASLEATSIKQTLDGGYILAISRRYYRFDVDCNAFYDAVIIKTDSKGQKEWDKIFSREDGRFFPFSVLTTSDGDYVVAGYTTHYLNRDAWLAKIRGELQVSVEENNKPSAFTLSQNYPNPFNPRTEITFEIPTDSQVTLTVFNALGQKVATLVDEVRQTGNHQVRWDGTEFPTGIYFYCLETQGFSKTMKMLLMK